MAYQRFMSLCVSADVCTDMSVSIERVSTKAWRKMTFHIYLYVRGTPEQEEFTKKGWLINDLCPHARLLHACNSSTKKRLNMQTHTHTNTHIDTHTHKHTYRYSETGEEAQTCTLYLACFQTCSQECSCNWLCCGVLAIIARCESEPIQNHRVPRAAMKT